MRQDKRDRIRWKLSIVAWLLAVSVAGGSAATVEEMLQGYPVRRGAACVPACGDGAEALELARTSEFLILVLDEDAAKVAARKEQAAAEGLLGRNLYVEQGSLETLPLADHLAAGDRAAVIRRSLDDGRVLDPVVLGGADQRVRWLAIENGVLFTLTGPEAPVRKPFEWIMQHEIRGAQHRDQTLFGRVLTATDLKSRRPLWTHAEPSPIDFRMVAISNGRVLFYSEDKRLAALAAADGDLLWENIARDWIDLIKRSPRPTNVNTESMNTLAAGAGLIRVSPFESGMSLLFREQDGRFLSADKGRFLGAGQKLPIVSVGGKVYVGKTETDPETGQKQGGELPSPAGSAWCGIATYAPGIGLIGHSSMTLKSPCGVGAWVAGGVLSYFPTVCDCGAAPGSVGFVSGAEVFRRMREAPEHPLIKGPAFGKTAASRDAPGEWTAYRGGIRHSGSNSTNIPVQADDLSWN